MLGGSPCQGFSFAGKQLAFDDPRSVLFFEYVRILKMIRKKNPDVKFFLENVRMKKEHEVVITEILGVEPIRINSALVSAQNRRRLYWTNINDGKIPQPEDRGILLKHILQDNVVGYDISDVALARILRTSDKGCKINRDKSPSLSTNNNSAELSARGTTLIGVTGYDGKITASDKSNCIDANFHKGPDNHGQRTFVQIINPIDSNGLQTCQQDRVMDINGKAKSLVAGSNGSSGDHNKIIIIPEGTKKGFIELMPGECFDAERPTSKTRKGRKMADKSNSLVTTNFFVQYTEDCKFRRLTEIECERLQTLPDNYTEGVSSTQRYRMLGNGWNVDTIVHMLQYYQP